MNYLSWFLVSLFYAFQYVLRVIPNVLSETLMQQFAIDAAVFGQMTGIYYIGYAIGHIPIGYALDKLGPRVVATAGLLLALLGLVPLVLTNMWFVAAAGRFLTGVGSAAAILSIFTVIRLGFPENRFSQMLGFTATIGLLGAIYGGRPISWMIEQDSWQSVIYLLIIVGLGLASLIWIFVPRRNLASSDTLEAQAIKKIFQNRKIIIICAAGGLMVGPLEGFADVWGQTFLTLIHGLPRDTAISITSLLFLGFGVGAPVLSLIGDKTKSYYLIIRLCALFMAASFVGIVFLKLHTLILAVMMALVGVASAYQVFVLYKTISYVPKALAGQASAVGNMIIMIFGYLFHSAIGGVTHLLKPTVGTLDAYPLRAAMLIIPLAQVLAYMMLLSFKDQRSPTPAT